jgi:hypothetical protein
VTDACSNCIFYGGDDSTCRQHAPDGQAPGRVTGVGQVVASTYWCGDGISSADAHVFSTKASPYVFGTGFTTCADPGLASIDMGAGIVTSEALIAQTSWSLILSCNKIKTTSVVLVNFWNSDGSAMTLKSLAIVNGQVTIAVGTALLTGTIVIAFSVFN